MKRREDKANDYQNVSISTNEINIVIRFLLFGLAMDMKNPNMLACVILFCNILYRHHHYGSGID